MNPPENEERDRRQHDERTPLLAPDAHTNEEPLALAIDTVKHNKYYILSVTITLLVLVDFGGYLAEAPQTDIFEGIICEQYYRNNKSLGLVGGADNDCNARPVQSELALVNELLRTFNQIPGILTALPYGILADRIGRRPVLLLSLWGICLQDLLAKIICWWPYIFPIRLVWLTPIGRLIGGGDAVASSMIYLIVADTFDAEERAGCFFKISAAILIGDITGTPLSAGLMRFSSWIPYTLALVLALVALLVPIIFLPETLPERPASVEVDGEGNSSDASTRKHSFARRARVWATELWHSKGHMFTDRNILLLLFSFFVASLGRQSTGFQLQYVRQRFGWTYSKASFMIVLRGIVNLALLLVILPFLNIVLEKHKWTAQFRDLFTTRVSVLALTVGSILMALAPHPVLVAIGVSVLALGSGFASTARSLVTIMTEKTNTGTLYTTLAVMSGIGGLIAGPLLALTFKWGLSLGRMWSGIPFLFVAGLFALALVAVLSVRPKSKHKVHLVQADEDTREHSG